MAEGKIIKALSGFYYVLSDGKIFQCRGRGVFRKNNITPLVGDYVIFQAENEKEGYIMEVKTRRNELVRPPIVNIDQAILVFSATEPAFNPALLDRFLVIVESRMVSPIICITKADLLNSQEREEINRYIHLYQSIGYEVLLLSAKTEEGIEDIRPFLADKTSVFAGQSGVGKSTLLNVLQPDLQMKTNEISTHLGRGKHTTRHVELVRVDSGLVADTPGFSSLEFTDIEAEELSSYFLEIEEKGRDCKFRGCLHLNEPKCAVKDAVEAEVIASFRYENYLQFLQEIRERKVRY
ncbi:ribosome small subunit-dependent GTPase A [Lederbergia graminis]|uniref:Small ribosomal subunit biogenesis GTPase RsgA n=1 Tax=Lederbergia graminis TaxID=735518 RepID=A0ABW0LDJ8_9BACI|nr:ribosome small subunit-dependent GTPase A [Paenibacillus bovis]HLU21947.1 ribosome small subunit-dependent GTPase A [Bacillaceae bacterium]